MKSLFIILLSITMSITAEAQSTTTHFNAEQKAVLATVEKMVAAFEKKDIDGIMATYETNAIVMFEPGVPLTGHDVLRKAFSQAVNINPQYQFHGHEVFISGNIATHITPWDMVGTLPDGSRIEESGLSVAILRKQADGSWLMIQDNPHGQFLLKSKQANN